MFSKSPKNVSWEIISWEKIPEFMKSDAVHKYYKILKKKSFILIFKKIFDFFLSLFLMIFFLPILFFIALLIKFDSSGKIIFKQKRITKYGKTFAILKFRTMIENAETIGPKLTVADDARITKIGKFLRKYHLDELPQLFNVLAGDMSFVGPRPEVEEYVKHYTNKMLAVLLLPAGITSNASISFKNENEILKKYKNFKTAYINIILPQKIKFELNYIEKLNIFSDIRIVFKTILRVFYKN